VVASPRYPSGNCRTQRTRVAHSQVGPQMERCCWHQAMMKRRFAGCTECGTGRHVGLLRWHLPLIVRGELNFGFSLEDPCVTRWWLDQVGDLARPRPRLARALADPPYGWLTVSAPRIRELSGGSVEFVAEKPFETCRSIMGPRLVCKKRFRPTAESRTEIDRYCNPDHSVVFHSRYGWLQSRFSRMSELSSFEPCAVPRSPFPERLSLENRLIIATVI
jgi:hypothetical protein